MIVVSERRIHL